MLTVLCMEGRQRGAGGGREGGTKTTPLVPASALITSLHVLKVPES